MRWTEWLRAAARHAARQQVTLAGLVFTLAAALVGVAAVVSANNLLFLVLAAMLSTLLMSGFVSRLSLAGLELEFLLPEHISAGRNVAARIHVRNLKRWMPSFSVHLIGTEESVLAANVYFPVISGGAQLEETVAVRFARRGVYRENSFVFQTRFPFGFLERRVQVTLRRDVLVYPSVDPQPGFEELLAAVSGEIDALQRGRGHDFYRIRPYEALESARHVDWKATAHTGELQVREFAREQERLLVIVLDLEAGAEQGAWLERAVDCCAFLVWRMAGRGARVRLRSQQFDVAIPAEGDVYTILKYLALVSSGRRKPPIAPDDDTSYHVVFTTRPAQMAALGWEHARLVGPLDLCAGEARGVGGVGAGDLGSAADGAAGAPGAGAHLDHGGGEDRR